MENTNYLLDEKFFEADQLIKENRIAEATKMLQEIVEEAPDHGMSHNHLGWIYETKYNDYTRAENHYKAALAMSPGYVAIYYNYAILLSTLGKYDELEQLLDNALKVPGINKATIYNEYGILREAQGRYEDAIAQYQNYIRSLYDNKLIETAQASIARCKMKTDLLKD
jgi:tetratricopeptide (TPR) repeat protein